jgi:hypothetical protein
MRFGRINREIVFLSCVSLSSLCFSYVDYGPIKSGDSLWKIAASHPVSHVSTQKMVHAIQALNPSTKKLKVGATLKIPSTLDEVKSALGVVTSSPVTQKASVASSVAAVSTAEVTTSTPSPSKISDAHSSVGTTQLVASAPLVVEQKNSGNMNKQETPTLTENHPAVVVSHEEGTSFWAWLWFFGLVLVLGFGWKNRYKLFSHLRGGKDIAARRLGLNRGDHEEAFDTNPLWTKGQPSYAESPIKKGDSMAEAMIQMAEGEYSEAKQTLLNAVELDPKSIDLRMKLLEVSVALDDRELFKKESDYLLQHLMDQADPRWGKIKSMYLRKWAYDPS